MFLSENGGKHQKTLLVSPFFRVNTAAPLTRGPYRGWNRYILADSPEMSLWNPTKKGLPAFTLWQFNLAIENGDFP